MQSTKYLCRFQIEPTPEQEEIIKYYLERTKLFWNYMVGQLGDLADSITLTGDGNPTPLNLEANRVFQQLISPDVLPSDFPEEIRKEIAAIREIPTDVLRCRLRNLLDAYHCGITTYRIGRPAPSLPSKKEDWNRLTAQFTVIKMSIVDLINEGKDVVSIGHPLKFDISIKNVRDLLLSKLHSEKAITGSYLQFSVSRSIDRSYVGDTPRYSYVVTVRPSDLIT